MLVPFVEFEFTHAIGPEPGRYLVDRHEEPDESRRGAVGSVAGQLRPRGSADVLSFRVQGAQVARPRGRRRRSARPAGPDDRQPAVSLLLARFIAATHVLASRDDAERLVELWRRSVDEQDRWIADALAVINRAVCAYRTGVPDPYAVDVTRADARRVRLGYGTGAEVDSGSWTAALDIRGRKPAGLSRAEEARPSEAVARVLAGRARLLEGEELVVRAALDREHGRPRAAALGLKAALDLLARELEDEPVSSQVLERWAALQARRSELARLTDRALEGGLAEADCDLLDALVDELLAVLQAWRFDSRD